MQWSGLVIWFTEQTSTVTLYGRCLQPESCGKQKIKLRKYKFGHSQRLSAILLQFYYFYLLYLKRFCLSVPCVIIWNSSWLTTGTERFTGGGLNFIGEMVSTGVSAARIGNLLGVMEVKVTDLDAHPANLGSVPVVNGIEICGTSETRSG